MFALFLDCQTSETYVVISRVVAIEMQVLEETVHLLAKNVLW